MSARWSVSDRSPGAQGVLRPTGKTERSRRPRSKVAKRFASLPVSFPRTDILTGGVWGLVAPASVNLVTPTHFFYAAPRIADPDPVSAVLTPSLVFREIPEQRKRRREPDGEIADEEESAAFHL